MLRFQTITIDSPDPWVLANFWEAALGWPRVEEDEEGVVLRSPDSTDGGSPVPDLLLYKVDDPRVVKNRLHFDFRPDDQNAEVARLERLGARRVDIGQGETTWVVLADPEGNEFCVLRSATSSS
jgi:hypothetical protein